MNDAKDRPRERFPPPATPYLPVQTGRGHVRKPAGLLRSGLEATTEEVPRMAKARTYAYPSAAHGTSSLL